MIPELSSLTLWMIGGGVVLSALVALVAFAPGRVENRLADIAADPSQRASASDAGMVELGQGFDRATRRRLQQEERKRRLRERMMQAGFYAAAAGPMFMMLRLSLVFGGAGLGFVLSLISQMPLLYGVGIGAFCGVAATVAPSFWLDRLKYRRQTTIRRALPDALDVLVVCLQGGLSVMASLSRVANELAVAHPMLAIELKIAERQMQMGQTAGETIRGIADRFALEELRGMGAVITQAERIGASVATALEVFAETLRLKRQQRAEELAHKAAVKLLIPTVLFIFPAIFVVILGPAAIQVYNNLIMGVLQSG